MSDRSKRVIDIKKAIKRIVFGLSAAERAALERAIERTTEGKHEAS